MTKKILVDAVYSEETRVVILEKNLIQEFDYETAAKKQLKGNIYLAKVTRVEPSLQAAFIDYGGDRHGFLPFSEIHPSYFQPLASDRPNDQSDEQNFVEDGSSDSALLDISHQLKTINTLDLSESEEITVNNSNELPAQDLEVLETVELSEHEFQDQPDIENLQEDYVEDPQATESSYNPYRQYKIQEVIKKNQIILVQVIKEERGNKGASFTSYISLAGRYCVLMPNSDKQNGISRRIDDIEDRRRLRSIIDELSTIANNSIIIRTAGSNKSKIEIKRDYDYLARLWNSICEHTLNSVAPAFIHAEGELIKRTIRDLFDDETIEILVQGEDSFKKIKEFMKTILPAKVNKVKQYKSKTPIFCRYQIDEQLSALYSPTANLSSGGYIVINQTEALIAIDVNSGRSTSERNVEETATKTNLEAAYEIARQLRLRDLSGLLVIDFIDMLEARNRRLVEKTFKEVMKHDRARIQIGNISSFGLLEMSRQRLRLSFIEANTIKCPNCSGKGIIRASESNAVMILRTLESEIHRGEYELINIFANPEIVVYMLNYKRIDINTIENCYNTKIIFFQDHKASADGFAIERVKRNNIVKNQSLPINIDPSYYDEEQQEDGKVYNKKRNWRSKETVIDEESTVNEQSLLTQIEINNEEGKKRKSNSRHNNRASNRIKNNKPSQSVLPNLIDEHQAEVVEVNTMPKKRSRRTNYRSKRATNQATANDLNSEATKSAGGSLLKDLWKKIIE